MVAAGRSCGPVFFGSFEFGNKIQGTAAAVLSDSVANVVRVDPQGEILREDIGEDLVVESTPAGSFQHYGVDFQRLNPDASISRSFLRVVGVPVFGNVLHQQTCYFETKMFHFITVLALLSKKRNKEIHSMLNFEFHLGGRSIFFNLMVLKFLWSASFNSLVSMLPNG